jgi:hypothetical protein
MTTRRRILFLSLAAVGVGLVAVVWLWLLWPRTLWHKDAERIHEGMTLAEVETILNGPADVQATWIFVTDTNKGTISRDVKLWYCLDVTEKSAYADANCISVAFDQNGEVISVSHIHHSPETFFATLRRRLGF